MIIVPSSHLGLEPPKPLQHRRAGGRLDDDGLGGWRDSRGMGRSEDGRVRQAISGSELQGTLSRAEIVEFFTGKTAVLVESEVLFAIIGISRRGRG